ncbi:MAG: MgtC/SapB family protein [Ruminococcaceae bacterium]|nr:MgtC/SapB family protein [Oscillospiraceae bacterium]
MEFELILRLFAAVVLGGIIGFERGINHDAGLRTHIVLCLGAASVMVLSEVLVEEYSISPEIMRMAAQVVSGVGFLGAGSIVVDGNRVRGITTAAGLWTTACVGLVVGAGYYAIAFAIVLLMLFSMLGLKSIMEKLRHDGLNYEVILEPSEEVRIQDLFERFNEESINVNKLKIEEKDGKTCVFLEIKVPKKIKIDEIVSELSRCCAVKEFKCI